ncbi:hypothetical protein ANO11243_097560 [Dothideomycetidae sp. 11243]|nr:hypothetical protein ANO11243_097560 [fungal sp. No.11243]
MQNAISATTNASRPGHARVFTADTGNNLLMIDWDSDTGKSTDIAFPPGTGTINREGLLYTTVSRGVTYVFVVGWSDSGLYVATVDGTGNTQAPQKISPHGDSLNVAPPIKWGGQTRRHRLQFVAHVDVKLVFVVVPCCAGLGYSEYFAFFPTPGLNQVDFNCRLASKHEGSRLSLDLGGQLDRSDPTRYYIVRDEPRRVGAIAQAYHGFGFLLPDVPELVSHHDCLTMSVSTSSQQLRAQTSSVLPGLDAVRLIALCKCQLEQEGIALPAVRQAPRAPSTATLACKTQYEKAVTNAFTYAPEFCKYMAAK